MNYFIEGIQGSGKSTLLQKLSEKYNNLSPIREGDYSPVELAWCTYMDIDAYEKTLSKYNDIKDLIESKTHTEGDKKIICYTQIITDIPGFHKDMEEYEIYNGRVKSSEEFKNIILKRYNSFCKSNKSTNYIFECSIFQNIIEDMILFQNASDDEILDFYHQLYKVLGDLDYKILYLKADDIPANIDVIRKERSDDKGNELWFPLMLDYFDNSPYAKAHGVKGEKALIEHLIHRQNLELQILMEIFPDKSVILKSKSEIDI